MAHRLSPRESQGQAKAKRRRASYQTYMCVNMHMIKLETLEATSAESLRVLKNQDPTGNRTQDLLIASQTLLPLSYWVSGGRGVQVYILRLSSHPISMYVYIQSHCITHHISKASGVADVSNMKHHLRFFDQSLQHGGGVHRPWLFPDHLPRTIHMTVTHICIEIARGPQGQIRTSYRVACRTFSGG